MCLQKIIRKSTVISLKSRGLFETEMRISLKNDEKLRRVSYTELSVRWFFSIDFQ